MFYVYRLITRFDFARLYLLVSINIKARCPTKTTLRKNTIMIQCIYLIFLSLVEKNLLPQIVDPGLGQIVDPFLGQKIRKNRY